MAIESVLIAGVGPGLGSALVDTFVAAGYEVVAAARRASELDERDGVHPVDCDLTEPDAVGALFARIERERAPLAAAVYNAGAFEPAEVADIDPDRFEHCWRVGCYGGFLVGREAARILRARGAGTIVFTGATASLRGGARFANLASPKFALRALAQSMARELGPAGVHVAHVIIDGQIRSPRYESLLDERGPDSLLEPTAIAETYLALHRQPRSAWTHELDLRPWVERF